MMGKMEGQKGFTLVELIIVVIILAILVGLAVPQYLNVLRRGREAEGWSGLAFIRSAEARYHVTEDTFGALASLDEDPTTPSFTYAVTDIAAATYNASATPIAAECPRCQTLVVNQDGTRSCSAGDC